MFPPYVNFPVMVAVLAFLAVTVPLELTEATEELEDDHVTLYPLGLTV